ncbi:MAG: SCP-2 sterol transfer family protein [Alphaproteobacteria bacterium]|nr:SCP-2 sterol transfer family protein [Alphaproteobacteria bacterium]MBF0128700.1 SCP-2 sterol transfer family protein [Alphaproteobacteria bacterium]
MTEIFSGEWMAKFGEAWNAEPTLSGELGKIGFSSTIAYGFHEEEQPRGVLVIENGRVVSAAAFSGQPLSWDMRASKEDWEKWAKKPPGLMGLGMAYTARKLRFKVGDYGAMIKDPRMAGPFIKSFEVMGRV